MVESEVMYAVPECLREFVLGMLHSVWM